MLPEYRHAGYRWNRNKMLRISYFLAEVNPIQVLLGQYTQSYLDCTMNLWNLPNDGYVDNITIVYHSKQITKFNNNCYKEIHKKQTHRNNKTLSHTFTTKYYFNTCEYLSSTTRSTTTIHITLFTKLLIQINRLIIIILRILPKLNRLILLRSPR